MCSIYLEEHHHKHLHKLCCWLTFTASLSQHYTHSFDTYTSVNISVCDNFTTGKTLYYGQNTFYLHVLKFDTHDLRIFGLVLQFKH